MFFDVQNETATLQDFAPLPEGSYQVCVTDIDVKDDKNGNEYIKVEATVTEGPSKNQKIFDQLYLKSEYSRRENEGRAKLVLLWKAVGVGNIMGPTDLKKLIGKEYWFKITQYKNKENKVQSQIADIALLMASGVSDDVEIIPLPFIQAAKKSNAAQNPFG